MLYTDGKKTTVPEVVQGRKKTSHPDFISFCTGPCSAVGNVSSDRCESDCRSRGREFNPDFLRSISSLLLNHVRRAVVSYKRNYVHEVLVNCLFKLTQKKAW